MLSNLDHLLKQRDELRAVERAALQQFFATKPATLDRRRAIKNLADAEKKLHDNTVLLESAEPLFAGYTARFDEASKMFWKYQDIPLPAYLAPSAPEIAQMALLSA